MFGVQLQQQQKTKNRSTTLIIKLRFIWNQQKFTPCKANELRKNICKYARYKINF